MSNEARKAKYRAAIDALVDGNDEQAEVNFHGGATHAVRDILGYSSSEDDETEETEEVDEFDTNDEFGTEDGGEGDDD